MCPIMTYALYTTLVTHFPMQSTLQSISTPSQCTLLTLPLTACYRQLVVQGDILAGCLGVATYWSGITNRPSEGKGVAVKMDTADTGNIGGYPFEWADVTTLTSDGRTILTGTTATSLGSNGSSNSSDGKSISSGESNSFDSTANSSSPLALGSTPSDLALVTPQMWSAALACSVTKRAGYLAFDKHHRAMTSPDVMAEIGTAFHEFSTGISP